MCVFVYIDKSEGSFNDGIKGQQTVQFQSFVLWIIYLLIPFYLLICYFVDCCLKALMLLFFRSAPIIFDADEGLVEWQ